MSDRFQSGQPLDVSTLNNIDDRLVELESKFTSFSTANTLEATFGSTIPVITSGNTDKVNIVKLETTVFDISSELSNAFSNVVDNKIYVVAIPTVNKDGDKTNLSISLSGNGTAKKITLSNNSSSTIAAGVQWIAFARKPI
jgi:hypothetical protein